MRNGVGLYLNKLESPPSKDALCQVWFKLAQWFWRRRFLNNFNIILHFRYYLPLEKGMALHMNKLESPLPKDALCQVLFKFVQWFWRRSWKCEKFTDGQTDDRQQAIRKAHLSFQLRWPNKNQQLYFKYFVRYNNALTFNSTLKIQLFKAWLPMVR